MKQRITKEWNNLQENLTFADMYKLSVEQGYTFNTFNTFSTFNTFNNNSEEKLQYLEELEEFEDIAKYPPNVRLELYLKYREMSYDELSYEFPEVVNIINNHLNRLPTHEDLFYYATRGWIPRYGSINTYLKRWKEYDQISYLGQSLLDEIYGDKIGYSTKFIHPLEQYIIQIDKNIGNESVLRSIGERLGLYIPLDKPAYESIYDGILYLLEDY